MKLFFDMTVKHKLFLGFVLLLTHFGCASTAQVSTSENNTDMIELDALSPQRYTFKVGQKASFSTKVHGSVGLWAEHKIEGDETLKLLSEEVKLDNESNAGMPGGDAAQKTFIFEAIKAGNSSIIIYENYRGELSKKASFKITVE